MRDVLSGVAKMAWDVMSRVTKTAWDVMSGVTKTAWDVLSGVANLCGMFCPGCKKMAWDVLSRDVLCLDRCSTCGQRYHCDLQKSETILILISLKRHFWHPKISILNSVSLP